MRTLRIVLVILMLLPAIAFAATDGTLGTTSTGTSDIEVIIPPLIRISGMADINFGTYGGTGDLNGNEDVCVYTNLASGEYLVTGTGSGAGSAFTLTDGTNTIAYNAYFNDVTGTTGEVALATTVQSGVQTGANTAALDCGGGNTSNFHVEILEANLQLKPAGTYQGTLTLVVEPN